ncbi:hypothetical protein [Staphylococcus delphini]|uniref:WDGH domain-containing protein n=1 Tax=Staphylococcus delphini TaxID=53344 RepID=A0AAX0QUX2_9STAP|nr:hypothetical protein [Staphylococcus delphini]PCF50118.1 hypothetical protein B5C07_07890 [Staphylococcus delphini]PNZ95739.1 hypothetical protein CD148_03430 [Staphylococcus delphini]RIZ56250.1 hypothetical protein CDL68_01535 [Staphylococcus delphini]VED62477.1 Uncharacterised protein [Staphylococcus delphini]
MKGFIINSLNNQIQQLKEKNIISTKEVSDGYHTFGQLYHDRAVLFAVILNTYKEKAWKSKQHHDGTMFGKPNEMFIVGVDTPEGQYTYHYPMVYWHMYDVKELDKAPEYDGHTFLDIDRLFGLID